MPLGDEIVGSSEIATLSHHQIVCSSQLARILIYVSFHRYHCVLAIKPVTLTAQLTEVRRSNPGATRDILFLLFLIAGSAKA